MDLYSEGMYRLPYRKLYRWEVLSYVHHTEKTGGSRTGDYAGHLEQRWAGYFEFYSSKAIKNSDVEELRNFLDELEAEHSGEDEC